MSKIATLRILHGFQTTWLDYPDNESLAVIVCMLGCDNCCKGCQNPDLKDYLYKHSSVIEYSVDEFSSNLLFECERQKTNKVVFSGGDPLSKFNIDNIKEVLAKVGSELDICVYTGHSVDYCRDNNVKGFKYLKCGHFDINNFRKSYKNDDEMCFASPNQELYNSEYRLLSVNGIYKFNKE